MHFATATAAIERGLGGGGVLVHCMQGRSRSATLVAAFLVRSGRAATLDAAAQAIVAARPIVSPNAGFVARLRAFEAHCRAGRDPDAFGK